MKLFLVCLDSFLKLCLVRFFGVRLKLEKFWEFLGLVGVFMSCVGAPNGLIDENAGRVLDRSIELVIAVENRSK